MNLNKYKNVFLMTDNLRSKIYLEEFKKMKIYFDKIIFLGNKEAFLKYKLRIKRNQNFELLNTNSINSKISIQKIKKMKNNLFIYSGFAGEKVDKKILETNNIFVHAHAGKLPEYKGSTTFYYSMIKNSNFYISIIIMNENIDQGLIVFKKKFDKFDRKIKKLSVFEIYARAKTLGIFLKNIKKKNIRLLKNNKLLNTNYFIAHPIIRFFGQRIYEKQI